MFLLKVYFIVNKFIKFINKNANVKSFQYIIFKQKIITFKKILNNIQIFKPYFTDKIKDLYIKKAYKKFD